MFDNIKKLWVDALRSGEYEQGKNVLRNIEKNTFCCLGVLCDIAIKQGLPIKTDTINDYSGDRVLKYNSNYENLPESVMDWAY